MPRTTIDFDGDVLVGEPYPGAVAIWADQGDLRVCFSMQPRQARKLALRLLTWAKEAEAEVRAINGAA